MTYFGYTGNARTCTTTKETDYDCVCKRANPTFKACTCPSPPASPPAIPAPRPPPFPPPLLDTIHHVPRDTCGNTDQRGYQYASKDEAEQACEDAGCSGQRQSCGRHSES